MQYLTFFVTCDNILLVYSEHRGTTLCSVFFFFSFFLSHGLVKACSMHTNFKFSRFSCRFLSFSFPLKQITERNYQLQWHHYFEKREVCMHVLNSFLHYNIYCQEPVHDIIYITLLECHCDRPPKQCVSSLICRRLYRRGIISGRRSG